MSATSLARCWTSTRSACLRSVTSKITPSIHVTAPLPSRSGRPRSWIQRVVPSECQTRYSSSYGCPVDTAPLTASVTVGRSSGTGRRASAWAPGRMRSPARYPAIDSMASLTYSNRHGRWAARRYTAPGMLSTSARNRASRSGRVIASARSLIWNLQPADPADTVRTDPRRRVTCPDRAHVHPARPGSCRARRPRHPAQWSPIQRPAAPPIRPQAPAGPPGSPERVARGAPAVSPALLPPPRGTGRCARDRRAGD